MGAAGLMGAGRMGAAMLEPRERLPWKLTQMPGQNDKQQPLHSLILHIMSACLQSSRRNGSGRRRWRPTEWRRPNAVGARWDREVFQLLACLVVGLWSGPDQVALHHCLLLPAWAGHLNPPLLACLACRHRWQLALRAAAAQADCAGGA